MNAKHKIFYYAKQMPGGLSVTDILPKCVPECEIERTVKESIDKVSHMEQTFEWHTYSSIVVNVFRIMILENIIPHDRIEFYADGELLPVNEFAVDTSHSSPWMETECHLSERILRAQMEKRRKSK